MGNMPTNLFESDSKTTVERVIDQDEHPMCNEMIILLRYYKNNNNYY